MLTFSVTDPDFRAITITSSQKDWGKMSPIMFYSESTAHSITKIAKKGFDVKCMLHSNSDLVKREIGDNVDLIYTLVDGEYLYDSVKKKIIFDFTTGKSFGFWTAAPRKIVAGSYTETYFGIGNDGKFYKAFRDESLVVPLAYIEAKNHFVTKVDNITTEGILLLIRLVEKKLDIRPCDYRNYLENLKSEVSKIQEKPPVPTHNLKLDNLLRSLKKLGVEKKENPPLDLFDDKLLTTSYIADYGIPPNIKEYVKVNMDIPIDHVNQVFTQNGKLYLYTFDDIKKESIAEFLSVPAEKLVLVKTTEK